MNKNMNCNNCGKQGHMFHQCKIPITSYGIILFRINDTKIQFLMIRRKDSFGYIDFVRGKYIPHNKEQLQKIFNEMSITEKQFIKNTTFEELWDEMWGGTAHLYQYKNEEIISQKKYDLLKTGINIQDNDTIMLDSLIDESTTSWTETEWEFPKGRRNYQEKDMECAIREFEEETGYSRENIHIIENIIPFEEIFIGSNHKSYKNKYYLAFMDKSMDILPNFQKSEVSKLEWKTIDECLASIRPYNIEKKQLIQNINKILQEFRLYL